jgi:primosomal protein N' (replication factor Y) (superfamily II helicase)
MSSHDFFYADILLPLPLPRPYTYVIPEELNGQIETGCRVLVQFGQKRIVTGFVKTIHQNKPEHYEAKPLIDKLDDDPLISQAQLNLIEWVSSYYMCPAGDVLNAAIPSGLKLHSESKIQLNPEFDESSNIPFADKELLITDALAKYGSLSFSEITGSTGIKSPLPFIKSLLQKGRILLFEEIKEKYTPQKLKKVRLHHSYRSPSGLQILFQKLQHKPKQTDIILKYVSLAPISKPEMSEKGIDKNYLKNLADSEAALRILIKEGILEEFTEIIPRFDFRDQETGFDLKLSPAQTVARDSILNLFREKETVLLHGVTGSGKTEIFIDLINKAVEGGSQVLYLLPEIALTTQIVSRLKKVFGNKLGVYHSRFSDNERVEVYKALLTGKINIIVGVRSSVFLPFDNLGLIIVDEEHETSYKQQEPSPRYHARDTALVLAKIHNAKTLLGTATPSVETYYNCRENRWGLVSLTQRYAEARLPQTSFVNIRRERKFKLMRNEFSPLLLEELKGVLERKEQAILFQNRRGYAPYLTCEDCAYVFRCKSCDVSLTYHLHSSELRCHYCGHTEMTPSSCIACGSSRIKSSGFGTEKLEDDLKIFLPEANVSRMDLDTTRKKNSFQEIISDFEEGKTDFLVGTQMVTKGFDFDRVSLVGIFDADRMLHFPDFRSFERTYQMLTQVSGRAGRKDKAGKVVIQTDNPEHKIYRFIAENDYLSLYEMEIEERRRFFYPPFSRIIKLTVRNPEKEIAEKSALKIFQQLVPKFGKERVLGPETPVINKIRNYYLQNIFIKLEREGINLPKTKSFIMENISQVMLGKEFRNTQVITDVDPV